MGRVLRDGVLIAADWLNRFVELVVVGGGFHLAPRTDTPDWSIRVLRAAWVSLCPDHPSSLLNHSELPNLPYGVERSAPNLGENDLSRRLDKIHNFPGTGNTMASRADGVYLRHCLPNVGKHWTQTWSLLLEPHCPAILSHCSDLVGKETNLGAAMAGWSGHHAQIASDGGWNGPLSRTPKRPHRIGGPWVERCSREAAAMRHLDIA